MSDETINIGDRVRLKGDLGHGPFGVNWMTVKRAETATPTGTTTEALFITVAYWTLNDAGHPFLVEMQGFRSASLTKEPTPGPETVAVRRTGRLAKPSRKR